MYNGIGLKTARGSGTNGYVQRNLSHVRPDVVRRLTGRDREGIEREKKAIAPNRDILEHDRKRAIELRLFELRVAMEDEGYDEEHIESSLVNFLTIITINPVYQCK